MARELDPDPENWDADDIEYASQRPELYGALLSGLQNREAARQAFQVTETPGGTTTTTPVVGPWAPPQRESPFDYESWKIEDLRDLSARRENVHEHYTPPADARRKADVIAALRAWDSDHPGAAGKVSG